MDQANVLCQLKKLDFTVEVPLDRRQRWAREFAPDISSLTVYLPGGTHARAGERAAAFAQLLDLWREPGEAAYVNPINVFLSRSKAEALIERLALEVDADLLARSEYLLRCDEETKLAAVLAELNAEHLVILFSRRPSDARVTVEHVLAYEKRYTAPEVPYVDRVGVHGGVLNYDGAALWALGLREFVVGRCLARLLGFLLGKPCRVG